MIKNLSCVTLEVARLPSHDNSCGIDVATLLIKHPLEVVICLQVYIAVWLQTPEPANQWFNCNYPSSHSVVYRAIPLHSISIL